MVNYISSWQTMALLRVITDRKGHSTGPVRALDPEEMKRQMMKKMRQQKTQWT